VVPEPVRAAFFPVSSNHKKDGSVEKIFVKKVKVE
jgi:hypothetical protein